MIQLILLLLLFPLSIFGKLPEPEIVDILQYKIDAHTKNMHYLMLESDDYQKDPKWIYLSGKTDAYYEILNLVDSIDYRLD